MVSQSLCATCPEYTLSIVPSVADTCFWLVVALKFINRWPSKANFLPISLFFVIPFSHPKQLDNAPPCDPSWLCLLSIFPSTVAADSQLIVTVKLLTLFKKG